MAVSATQLRQNIYAILDEVLATGKPVEIERKGKVLRIVPGAASSAESGEDDLREFPRLARLKNHHLVIGEPEDLASLEWNHDWTALVAKKPKRKRA